MAINPHCDFCLQELAHLGGILLSPPDAASRVKKLHVCKPCYAAIAAALPKIARAKAKPQA